MPTTTWMSFEHICRVKEARHKRLYIIDSTYMKCPDWANLQKNKVD